MAEQDTDERDGHPLMSHAADDRRKSYPDSPDSPDSPDGDERDDLYGEDSFPASDPPSTWGGKSREARRASRRGGGGLR